MHTTRRTHRSTTRTALAVALSAGLLLAACAGDPETDPTTPEPTETETEPTETESPEPDPTDDDSDSADDGSTGSPDTEPGEQTEGTVRIDDDDLPGEAAPMFFADEGEQVHVVGVEFDDVLFVRASPDANADEVHRLAPTGEAVLAGREQSVDHGRWAELELSGGYGWVNTFYLGYLGQTHDRTSDFQDLPPVQDPQELIGSVVQAIDESVSADGGPELTWALVDQPEGGDFVEYVVDVLGFPDDSIRGERLRLFIEETGDGARLDTVEATSVCLRGLAEEGLCT